MLRPESISRDSPVVVSPGSGGEGARLDVRCPELLKRPIKEPINDSMVVIEDRNEMRLVDVHV